VERDDEHEQQARRGAREQAARERRSHQERGEPGEPRHRPEHRLGQREHLREHPAHGHEADGPNGQLDQRLLDEIHRPGALVEPKGRDLPEVAAGAKKQAEQHHGRRQRGEDALGHRRTAPPREPLEDEPRVEPGTNLHGPETYGPML
jgi:hypothetical protein